MMSLVIYVGEFAGLLNPSVLMAGMQRTKGHMTILAGLAASLNSDNSEDGLDRWLKE
jgi:hypothetical protein